MKVKKWGCFTTMTVKEWFESISSYGMLTIEQIEINKKMGIIHFNKVSIANGVDLIYYVGSQYHEGRGLYDDLKYVATFSHRDNKLHDYPVCPDCPEAHRWHSYCICNFLWSIGVEKGYSTEKLVDKFHKDLSQEISKINREEKYGLDIKKLKELIFNLKEDVLFEYLSRPEAYVEMRAWEIIFELTK